MLTQTDKVISLLKESPVFATLGESELAEIIPICSRKKYGDSQVVFWMEQEARFFYIVESGSFILNLRNRKFVNFKRGDVFGEIAVINENVRTGSIKAVEESSLIAVNGDRLFDPAYVRSETALKVLRELAKIVTNYLRAPDQIPTLEILAKGENEGAEFKSSLRWNPQNQENDRNREDAILKTIAAFLNSRGGTLLVGVNDEGEVIGIGQEKFENGDKMLLHLTRLIKERISSLHIRFVRYEIEEFGGQQILRVDCDPATMPAYLKEGKHAEKFYVRTGPSTTHLKVSKIFDYIKLRF